MNHLSEDNRIVVIPVNATRRRCRAPSGQRLRNAALNLRRGAIDAATELKPIDVPEPANFKKSVAYCATLAETTVLSWRLFAPPQETGVSSAMAVRYWRRFSWLWRFWPLPCPADCGATLLRKPAALILVAVRRPPGAHRRALVEIERRHQMSNQFLQRTCRGPRCSG